MSTGPRSEDYASASTKRCGTTWCRCRDRYFSGVISTVYSTPGWIGMRHRDAGQGRKARSFRSLSEIRAWWIRRTLWPPTVPWTRPTAAGGFRIDRFYVPSTLLSKVEILCPYPPGDNRSHGLDAGVGVKSPPAKGAPPSTPALPHRGAEHRRYSGVDNGSHHPASGPRDLVRDGI